MRSYAVLMAVCLLVFLSSRSAPAAAPVDAPHYYAIVVGVSQYAGESLHLRFAATDAGSMANALKLGATRLFGAEKVNVILLSTEKGAGIISPTKKNIKQAFETVTNTATAGDVLVVYFSGHGITLPQGQNLYCFLTSEARSTADLIDPGLRNITFITSEELHQWLTKIPARKQVIILDTCAAGAASENLMETRDITGDQQQAIARLREREGVHILMGCAADSRSYETSQYGQGLLTYSLLEGMKGAALRQDKFLDISTLFSYAADNVPTLAKNIGGIQRPVCAISPGGSFDIGELTTEDRQQVKLAELKPMVLRPVLLNPEVIGDPLHLSSALLAKLRDAAQPAEAKPAAFVFIDTADFPGAITPKGLYTVQGTQVQVTMKLWRDGKVVGDVTATGDTATPEKLLDTLVSAIIKELKKK
ncbi:MAG: caspase family protein [bacterium]